MGHRTYMQKMLYSLLLVFSFMTLCGVGMVVCSLATSQTTAEAALSGSSVTFKIETGIPGVVLVFLGASGLLTLLIKIPVTRAVEVPVSRRFDCSSVGEATMMYSTMSTSAAAVSTDCDMPVLMYWLLKEKMNLSRRSY